MSEVENEGLSACADHRCQRLKVKCGLCACDDHRCQRLKVMCGLSARAGQTLNEICGADWPLASLTQSLTAH